MPTRAFGSASKDCQTSRSSRAVRASIALRASGRLRRKIRTGPSAEMRTGRSKGSGLTLQHRLANDLFESRHAVADLLEAAAAQGHHAVLDGFLPQLEGAAAGEDHLPHLVLDLQHLVEADAALVAGVAATVAAAAFEELERARLVLREAGLHERRRGNFQ